MLPLNLCPENYMFLLTVSKDSYAGFHSIVEAHERQLRIENNPDFAARFTLKLPLVQDAWPSATEGSGESLPGFVYKEYVIYRAPMDCYHHPVHLPECYLSPARSETTLSTTHTARRGVVVGNHTNRKGAHRAISQRKSSHWRSS
jgi:hypothetical protein